MTGSAVTNLTVNDYDKSDVINLTDVTNLTVSDLEGTEAINVTVRDH